MESKGKRILVVDDDKENIELLTQYLAKEGHTISNAADADGALHRVKAWKPHLVLLDVNMPGMSGLELIPKIRAANGEDYCSIVLVSGNTSLEDVNKGFDAGADDYLAKPFRAQDLLSHVRTSLRLKEVHDSLRRANHRIEDLNSSDDLTGLLNMRAIFKKGEDEILRARRSRKAISVLLINLDGFKAINRSSDFIFGSQVIKAAASKIRQCVRTIDWIARVGGDEFFVILTETDLSGAEFLAERIRDALQNLGPNPLPKVTACIGVAGLTYENKEETISDLLKYADEALQTAKNAGPNRIEVYSFV